MHYSPGVVHSIGVYDTADIMRMVLMSDADSAKYTKAYAHTFAGRDIRETCNNIWKFLTTQITYSLDKNGVQDVKQPSALIYYGKGDCKSFTIFTGSILQNLGIKYNIRFAAYDKNDPNPTHVYVVAFDENNRPIVIDAVLKKPFGSEDTHHTNLIDKAGFRPSTLNPQLSTKFKMPLRQIAGIPDHTIQGFSSPFRATAINHFPYASIGATSLADIQKYLTKNAASSVADATNAVNILSAFTRTVLFSALPTATRVKINDAIDHYKKEVTRLSASVSKFTQAQIDAIKKDPFAYLAKVDKRFTDNWAKLTYPGVLYVYADANSLSEKAKAKRNACILFYKAFALALSTAFKAAQIPLTITEKDLFDYAALSIKAKGINPEGYMPKVYFAYKNYRAKTKNPLSYEAWLKTLKKPKVSGLGGAAVASDAANPDKYINPDTNQLVGNNKEGVNLASFLSGVNLQSIIDLLGSLLKSFGGKTSDVPPPPGSSDFTGDGTGTTEPKKDEGMSTGTMAIIALGLAKLAHIF